MGRSEPFEDRDAVMEVFARHVSAGKVGAYRAFGLDVVMGRREGVRFWDAYGQQSWINCHCNGGVFNLGHRNPRILRAVRAAMDSLDIGNHHLISGHRAQLARRLAATTGDHLPGVVFGVAGGEAIDLAIKVVRGVSGRRKIISVRGGYHGHTGLALAAGDPQYRDPFGPNLPDFAQVRFDDLQALSGEMDEQTAAVLVEPIPATLGMPIPSPGYFQGVAELCRARGARLIVDEVQTGLGRTGRIWGYQHEGLEPDMLVTGKGLSGGVYPIAATLMTSELHAFFIDHPFIHISTFGGSELGCAAALEVLNVIEEDGFLERVQAQAERLAQALGALPLQLRQRGLMMGLKFSGEGAGMAAAQAAYAQGLFCVWANNDPSVLQFLPPLILSDDELTELCQRARRAFS